MSTGGIALCSPTEPILKTSFDMLSEKYVQGCVKEKLKSEVLGKQLDESWLLVNLEKKDFQLVETRFKNEKDPQVTNVEKE